MFLNFNLNFKFLFLNQLFFKRPPKITAPANQNAQISIPATNTIASSAAASFTSTNTSTNTVNSSLTNQLASNIMNNLIQHKQQTQLIDSSNKQVTASDAQTNLIKNVSSISSGVVKAHAPKETTISAPPPNPVTVKDTEVINEQIPKQVENTPAISKTKPETSLPKAVYDSLAPLNLPSKPIIYLDEKQTSDTNQNISECNASMATSSSNTTTTVTADGAIINNNELNLQVASEKEKAEISRLDEKAKLESILLSSITQTSSYHHKGS